MPMTNFYHTALHTYIHTYRFQYYNILSFGSKIEREMTVIIHLYLSAERTYVRTVHCKYSLVAYNVRMYGT